MDEVTLTYQELISAVYVATGARATVYPNDYSYVALPHKTVQSIVESFDPGQYIDEVDDCDDKSRRLWYRFKEYNSLCACGMVRISNPVAHDLVGVVTVEDLQAEAAHQQIPAAFMPIREDLFSDDLAEIPGADRHMGPAFKPSQARNAAVRTVEMSLIEPQTRQIFKRSQGGSFGTGRWDVSAIKALAVWF
ncbi:MAG TPA: hypothetical protein VN455_14630 [Methanotrichaceae archaeon]|nr:hypothetical protein [Methanotrichaceae archaeon]